MLHVDRLHRPAGIRPFLGLAQRTQTAIPLGIEAAAAGDAIVVGASVRGVPAGVAWALPTEAPQIAFFAYITVVPTHRGLGTAARLDRRLVEEAGAAGHSWGVATAHPDNFASRSFLEKAGWEQVGVAPRIFGRHQDRMVYLRRLAENAGVEPDEGSLRRLLGNVRSVQLSPGSP